ncbi:tRNA (adenine(58)-N(1))-methyltransferase non-catalytic subunit TRM6-like isoform X2 [Hylaeus volcanicus]|uniref:tRNA (adenine(58)-N(1))-methyltransferase non-catalytic subunit TRM6-like isoform X2 n=1 Tax=Hylaeus volcanicus TaxID=313075 RepID=UPI0023B831B1|nr:tRNA (adenine(58)-N(1))-methyltransferase non-catalytic subunit TRM6-like isoform X2 [Hylaeus volcanicus]
MKLRNMCEFEEDIITVGKYVIVKKLNFKKIYKVTASGSLMLGKDLVDMREIIGKRFWTSFEMIPSKDGKRSFSLKEVTETESWDDLLSTLSSGNDNRTIIDDGNSQKLSKEEILRLQESGKTGKEIVGSLIENNKSFLERTEYSQEKYLKKKEQKYLRHLTICKPNISSLHSIYFKLDHNKIGNLRMDALAQLLSYSDVQSDGLYILYNSGSQGLPTAAMLNRIGANTAGHLINLHPGNVPQATIVHAMNFPKEQLDRLINVNIYSFLRLYHQGESAVLNNILTLKKPRDSWTKKIKKNASNVSDKNCIDNQISENKETSNKECLKSVSDTSKITENNETSKEESVNSCSTATKRKLDESEEGNSMEDVPAKKPKWLLETQCAVDLVQKVKARGLVIVAKEHPLNIVTALLPFLGVSRPFVIFHIYREPLQETYMMLKQRQNVINLRLFSNFLRSYQVLPDRTHPDILTSDTDEE